MKIHTLTIEHRHGRDVTGHATHQEAEAELARYVRGWWEHERISDAGAPPPDDDAEAIALYFERCSDESATIDECELSLPVDHGQAVARLHQAVECWPEFDGDSEVNGGDLVEWFAEWRANAKELLGIGTIPA